MSSNSTSQGGSGGSNDDDYTELIVAIAALAISVVALVIAVFQALQQYYGSAEGYSSCNEKIIGDWSEFTKRRLILKQFRIEVRFRVPVIFVAPPQNVYGPLGDADEKEIVYFDGTADNYKKTHTWTPEEFDVKQNAKLKGTDTRETIHTADNELTTWLALMMAIQRMERESGEWQSRICDTYEPPIAPPENRHTMAAGMQEKVRSWDVMPDGLKKPYATTAICHFVEIMAMLGIYWKEFDRSKNMYRAQGNGFSVTGSMVPNLGIAFTFEKIGKTWFQENRIVPNDSVKQLCFGFCPTIFQAGLKTPLYTDEPKDEGTLQLGTKAEVAETLVSFGCNTNTVNYFRYGNEQTRYSHLFPLPFEMLGMVGEVLQIRHTTFTMLPNPTYFTWNKSAFSLISLLKAFGRSLDEAASDEGLTVKPGSRLGAIKEDIDLVLAIATEDAQKKRRDDIEHAAKRKIAEVKKLADARNHVRKKIDTAKASATSTPAWISKLEGVPASIRATARKTLARLRLASDPDLAARAAHEKALAPNVRPRKSFPIYLETLHHAIKRCDLFLGQNYDLVQHVFALHLQEVLCYLNSRPQSPDDEPHTTGAGAGAGKPGHHSKTSKRESRSHIFIPPPENSDYYNEQYIPLHMIDTASWTERHRLLMQLYVFFIRRRVTEILIPDAVSTYTQNRARNLERQNSSTLSALASVADDGNTAQATAQAAAQGSAGGQSPTEASAAGASATGANAAMAAEAAVRTRDNDTFTRPTTAKDVDDIWCTLTFRMICWLMLHDFHKKDIQISKSDVYDSRLAVYIL